ncbi:MAG: ABC transporter substrate-binding protein [Candidatus Omnitrophica bacterium]|nr:ABC transporter substrate-binding protein [Candidatus Omnitrophota bacterium]
MKKLLNSLLIAGLLIGVTGVNSIFAEGKKPKVIRLGSAYGGGYGKPFSSGTIGIVHAKGLLEEEFKKDGVKIDWYFFKGAGPATNEAIANNTLDFGYIGDLPSIVGRAGGLKTKLLAAGSVRAEIYILIPADSPVTSIKELKGKKVGIFKGINSHLGITRILEANGLTEKDLKVYNLGTADIEAALASKDIDAGGGGLRLRDLGLVKVLLSTNPVLPGIDASLKVPIQWKPTGGLFVTEKFANEYPDIVKRVVRVYVEAAKWGSEEKNREEVFQLWSKVGTPLSQIKETNAGKTLKQLNTPLIDGFYVTHYKDALLYSKEHKFIRNTFDVDSWIDRSYLNAALKELGLENFWQPYEAE